MEERSLSTMLTRLLLDAKSAHSTAVELGRATIEDWPEWYASYIARRLTPMLSMVQGGPGWIAEASHDKILPRQMLEDRLYFAATGKRRNPHQVSD